MEPVTIHTISSWKSGNVGEVRFRCVQVAEGQPEVMGAWIFLAPGSGQPVLVTPDATSEETAEEGDEAVAAEALRLLGLE